MNAVERVKVICKERKIPISRLEKDLGYANAYISQLRKGTFPADRLMEIANYLSVTPEYLLNGTDKNESSPANSSKGADKGIRRIERARRQMSEDDKEKMMKLLELSFSDYFSDDFEDDDLNE